MTKTVSIFLFLLLPCALFAQQFSEYEESARKYISLRTHDPFFRVQTEEPFSADEYRKCGLFTLMQLRSAQNLSPELQGAVQSLFERPVLDTSFITPAGFFTVHYDTTGIHAPAYDVRQLAEALDSSYRFEVNYLGYPPPAGSGVYDIYVENLGSIYGETVPGDEIDPGSGRFYSFIRIDNDFAGFPTIGINGARVTAAHELHHAIQIANYIYRSADIFFYEISSTAMEEFVYDDVNDYYNYLKSYFYYPEISFARNNGYNLAHWNIFLQARHGFDVLRRQWELLPGRRALDAIAVSLQEAGSSFKPEFTEFSVWNFFTGYRAKPGSCFEEASFYPVFHSIMTTEVNHAPLELSSAPVTNQLLQFRNLNTGDTVSMLVSNADVARGIAEPLFHSVVKLGVNDTRVSGSTSLGEGYYYTSETEEPMFFSYTGCLNNALFGENGSRVTELEIFPSPFVYARSVSGSVTLRLPKEVYGQAAIGLYTTSMECIRTEAVSFPAGLPKTVFFPLAYPNGEALPTGVYFIVVQAGENYYSGKLAVIYE